MVAPTAVDSQDYSHVPIKDSVLKSPFAQEPAPKSLRVCCYGSSSSKTPERYLQEARHLGYLLARRGHVCVNGAGSFGCMAAMNDGACRGNGHIVGVIHEMWLVDSKDWGVTLRDGGAHTAFADPSVQQSHGGPHPSLQSDTKKGPIREMLVAGGKDLQERKRLLVDKASALVVLPGGPGTWDELWEMACARNLGLVKLPIVCVNVDGFYDHFRLILERAWYDELTKLQPDQIIHFVETAEEAVRWIEDIQSEKGPDVQIQKRASTLRRSSFLHVPILGRTDSWFSSTLHRAGSWVSEQSRRSFVRAKSLVSFEEGKEKEIKAKVAVWLSLAFGAGVTVGLLVRKQERLV